MTIRIFSLMTCYLASIVSAIAGGPSSTVDITKIYEIKITKDMITIVGDVVCKTALASAARESANVPLQSTPITTVANRVRINIVPYFSRTDITGVCMGNETRESLLERCSDLFADNWKRNTDQANKLVKGGTASIEFQGEMISFTGFEIKEITGWGGLSEKQ